MGSARGIARLGRKQVKRARNRIVLQKLIMRNRASRKSVLGDAQVIVSLTTYGRRLGTVAYTIESIAAGTVRPRELILWLDDDRSYTERPAAIRRLEARGLTVMLTRNYGPHTKYYPSLERAAKSNLRIATADDDILYPRYWLRGLLDAAAAFPEAVNSYRASIVTLDDHHRIAPYATWPWCRTTRPGVDHLATGVSGILYPLSMIEQLQQYGTGFTTTCPRTDDIWLHWVALRSGIQVRQVSSRPRHFPIIPGSQQQALLDENVLNGGNDATITALYDESDRATLRQAASAHVPSVAP